MARRVEDDLTLRWKSSSVRLSHQTPTNIREIPPTEANCRTVLTWVMLYHSLGALLERFRSSEIITIGRTKWALVFIAAFAVLYNFTRFFEITWTLAQDPTDPNNGTLRAELITTKLREDPIYISVYITGMYLVFMYTLPFSGLSILNYLIFVDVRKVFQIQNWLKLKREHYD